MTKWFSICNFFHFRFADRNIVLNFAESKNIESFLNMPRGVNPNSLKNLERRGKKKGSTHRLTLPLRDFWQKLLNENQEDIQAAFERLNDRDKVAIALKVTEMLLPKLLVQPDADNVVFEIVGGENTDNQMVTQITEDAEAVDAE